MPSNNNGSGDVTGSNGSTAVNPDKAIARLLYAMLKQKSLKDIDWNQVACDPVLLEEISNGHAARMRYSRFRNATENSIKNGSNGSGSAAKSKTKNAKSRRNSGKRDHQDMDEDGDGEDTKANIKADTAVSSTEDAGDRGNGPSLDLDLNLDGAQPDTFQDTAPLAIEKALEDLTNTSFTSSLPSPPIDSNPMADSLAILERKKKMRKLYTFSPTMTSQTLHQIPLPRGAVSQTSMAAIRVHSLPTLPTNAASTSPSTATTPVNLSGALMMRHRSAGSLAPELQQQQQPQMLRQTRMMTPSSDVDNHPYNPHHGQHHTQLSLPADGSLGLDATFDFAFAGNSTNNNCNANGSSTTGHPSPWIATPFSSPPVPTFDMSPYATTIDMMGGGVGSLDPESQPLPSLFQTQFDSQQQQQDALQATFMAHAFAKHGSWDAMLGQGNGMQGHQL
ncbi:hypothetical protein SBRCBS47491_007161 [Sporothrix bragantina]|uniref:Myb-like DNA-binding domain-containing protein n=1 Tax=Sporothrix bragantina TaxID=671064 RepID=A0ABP0CAW2_9PEZI